jgi:hypothetical protein
MYFTLNLFIYLDGKEMGEGGMEWKRKVNGVGNT